LRERRQSTAERVLRRRGAVMPALLALATASCAPSGAGVLLAAAQSSDTGVTEVVIDSAVQHQKISGFGASSAWTGGSITPDVADLLFSPDTGFGLSLLRMHIAPDGTTEETGTALLAVARGVKVWAAPWSPPGEWKTSGTDTDGGSLLPEHYQDWADRLADFVAAQAGGGVPLMALSAQNEPNWTATWETCTYTPDDLNTFIRDYLAPALAAKSPSTTLLAPETIDWTTLSGFADTLLADPVTTAALGIVAVHDYGGAPYDYEAPAANGKEFWETEVSYDDQSGMLATLETAREVERHLVDGNVNAFHYWWLVSDTTGGLISNGVPTPQAYGLAHYSKFIRPGYVRLDMTSQPVAGVSTSAFYDPVSAHTIVVAVNENDAAVDLSLRFAGIAPASIAPWLTTADVSLAVQPSVPFTTPFAYSLPPSSVTTLVTEYDTPPPAAGAGGESGIAGASDAGGASLGGASGEAGAASGSNGGTGGTSSHGAGGSGSTKSSGGTHSAGGSSGTRAATGDAGAGELDGGVADDGGSVRRVPGYYSPCICTLPAAGGGGSVNGAPLLAAVVVFVRRRRRERRS
jgi:glucuronoarabinoxylan endo-1,4-beta-xylanase